MALINSVFVEPIVTVPSGHQFRAERWSGLDTGWRSLPDTLVETSRDGTWAVEVDEGAQEVGKGRVIVIPAGVRHRLRATSREAMHSSWIHLHWTVADLPLRLAGSVVVLNSAECAAHVEGLCEVAGAGQTWLERVRFQRLGLEVLESVAGRLEVRASGDARIGRAVEFARANLGRTVSRADLARAAGLSETRLHDLFFAATGEAPVQFLNRLRLRQAVTQLLQTEMPVGEIARGCGFASDYYFSRFFKQKIGVSPRHFRQTMGGR